MFKKTKNIAVAAILSVATLTGMAATAEAKHKHNGGGVSIQLQFGESSYTNWRRDRHWRHGGFARVCSTDRALNKAHRMGVRHARVRFANRNVINVKGRSHGHRVSILFSRAPGCPVIRY